MSDPFSVVRQFEKDLCEYTGAKYAVAVNSCTMALLLAVKWHLRNKKSTPKEVLTESGSHAMAWIDDISVEIPKHTYVSVPQSIIHAGGRPVFRDEEWFGMYQLKPLPVWDSARWFSSGMYSHSILNGVTGDIYFSDRKIHMAGQMQCLSFHISKTLGDTQGGAILHDNDEADAWLRRARFDGRTEGVAPKDDTFNMVGWHCYMSPDVAARLIWKLARLPLHNPPLPNDDYQDLSTIEAFK